MEILTPGQVGARIRAAREYAGLSGAELARLAGLPYRTYQDIERGEGMPSLDRFVRIAVVLGLSLDELYAYPLSSARLRVE